MALTYRALGAMLTYPTEAFAELMAASAAVIEAEQLAPERLRRRLAAFAGELAGADLYERQANYVDLFDRTRSLSLQLYEHVHGESRDRGQAMVELLKLYSAHGLELTARELPDHLPVFLEFLSTLSAARAAALLGQAGHVLEALRERLVKRGSAYACVFEALCSLAAKGGRDAAALAALMAEPDDDPDDLDALDRAWGEEQVRFGPDKVGCPKAEAMVARIGGDAP